MPRSRTSSHSRTRPTRRATTSRRLPELRHGAVERDLEVAPRLLDPGPQLAERRARGLALGFPLPGEPPGLLLGLLGPAPQVVDDGPELPKLGLTCAPLDEALAGADVAVIVTAHPSVDHNAVAASVPVVDLRGVTRKAIGKTKPKGRGRPARTRRTEEVAA